MAVVTDPFAEELRPIVILGPDEVLHPLPMTIESLVKHSAEFPMEVALLASALAAFPRAIAEIPLAFAAVVVRVPADSIELVPEPAIKPPAEIPITVAPETSRVPVKLAEVVPKESVESFPRPSDRTSSVGLIATL